MNEPDANINSTKSMFKKTRISSAKYATKLATYFCFLFLNLFNWNKTHLKIKFFAKSLTKAEVNTYITLFHTNYNLLSYLLLLIFLLFTLKHKNSPRVYVFVWFTSIMLHNPLQSLLVNLLRSVVYNQI